MANKRMFSLDIVDTDAFLDMPQSSQLLYFHLGMRADDIGFVNPRKIMRTVGSSDDDLKVLFTKNFLIPFESGVVVIKHWQIHNTLQKDRIKETQYVEEKAKLLIKIHNKAYTLDPLQGVPLPSVEGVKKLNDSGGSAEVVAKRYQDGSKALPQDSLSLSIGKIREEKRSSNATLFESKDSDSLTQPLKEIVGTETFKENTVTLQKLIADGEFQKSKYICPEEGPFDWKYLIDGGKRLVPGKYMIALFWKEQQTYKKFCEQFGISYNFPKKDKASALLERDLSYGKQLASSITFDELPKLIEVTDESSWDEKTKEYSYEWKISTLGKNISKLNE